MSNFVPIFRGSVNARECDIMGHFNVQFYAAKMFEGLNHLKLQLGLSPDRNITWQANRLFSRYQGELHAGDIVDIRAGILAVEADRVHILAEIMNGETGKMSASFELWCDGFNTATQQSTPWPDDIQHKMTAMEISRADEPRAPTAGGPVPEHSNTLSEPFVSARGSIAAWDCDGDGVMAPQRYYAVGSDGVLNVRHRMGFTREVNEAGNLGGAALEYDVRVYAPMRAGDLYTLRSGILDLGAKTFRFGHAFHNDTDGTLAATYDVVGVLFDLKARRATAIPDFIREQSKSLIIPWPPTR
ncbi:MAG: thioesterase family protein [Alphaproteobacteria bacterium]|nr:thioesterase family protein [Alphaproteobacteria bacterium]